MRLSVVVALALGGLVLAGARAEAAPPPPPPKFWSADRCERLFAHDHWITNEQGYAFHPGLTICVGTGGPQACVWTTDHRSRLYSQFTVFARSRFIGGVVRSFTLATRVGPGLARMGPGGDKYRGWPAEFYFSPASVRLLAPDATPARFRALVVPLAADLTRVENAAGCTGAVR